MKFPTGSTYIPMDQWITSTFMDEKIAKVRTYPIDARVLTYIKKKRKADVLQIAEAFGIGWIKANRICMRLKDSGRIVECRGA